MAEIGGRNGGHRPITRAEVEDIENHARLSTRVIYEIVRHEGRKEMRRPAVSLWWSGLAAGLSISFSLFAQAVLRLYLPDAGWRPLVECFGYSVGFLLVVMARQQLFTENTITAVLPLLKEFTRRNLLLTARLWIVVLVANLTGTFAAALFCSLTPGIDPALRGAMLAISAHAMDHGWWEMVFLAISAGFLIAAMVWLIPSAKGSEFLVVTLLTYVIAVGGFAHIVAGSMEAFMLILAGLASPGAMAWNFLVPVLIGNVFGGTVLFTMISYAQVMEEI